MPALEPGTRLGAYEILAPLGEGSMGQVYRARDLRLDRQVAIKVLPAILATDRGALRRFEREAKAVAALSHPNILAIFDFGREGDAVYAVMELLDGEDLRQRLKGGALPVRKALEIAAQVAEGLAAAHAKGIVHRDLKPANLFLTRDGRIKILDFGLARQIIPSDSDGYTTPPSLERTMPGAVLGTVGYMAPEQAVGEPADARADLFALGIVLFEMLSGERAFRRATLVETLTAIIGDDPEPLRRGDRTLPPPIERLVMRCLEKNPAERFQSADDLAFQLRALADGSEDQDHEAAERSAAPTQPALSFKHQRLFRRRRGLLAGAALVGLGVVLGVFLGRGLDPPGTAEQASPPVKIRPLTFSGQDRAPAASPDGQIVAFTSERDGRRRIWLKRLAGGDEAPLTDGPDDDARFSPDGEAVLFIRDQDDGTRSAYRVGLFGGPPSKLIEDVYEADWSPDGERLAFLRAERQGDTLRAIVGLARVDGSVLQELAMSENRLYYGIRWSPDARYLVVAEGLPNITLNAMLVLLDVETGESRHLTPPQTESALTTPAWLDTGTLVFGRPEVDLATVAQSLAQVVQHNVHDSTEDLLFWAPHLFSLASVGRFDVLGPGRLVYDELVLHQDLRQIRPGEISAAASQALTRGLSRDRQPVLSPDGRSLGFSSDRSGNLDIWILDLDGGALRQLTRDPAGDWDPTFTPDGRQILWSSNRGGHLEIWIASVDGGAVRQVTHDGYNAENPTVSTGGWVFYGSSNPQAPGIWRKRLDGTGEAERILEGIWFLPEISPDGRYLMALRNDTLNTRNALHVYDLDRSAPTRFSIELAVDRGRQSQAVLLGRARWFPDQRIAYLDIGPDGRIGIFIQDFDPDGDTRSSRRPLAGFEGDGVVESYAVGADGESLVLSVQETRSGLMIAEDVPGIAVDQSSSQ